MSLTTYLNNTTVVSSGGGSSPDYGVLTGADSSVNNTDGKEDGTTYHIGGTDVETVFQVAGINVCKGDVIQKINGSYVLIKDTVLHHHVVRTTTSTARQNITAPDGWIYVGETIGWFGDIYQLAPTQQNSYDSQVGYSPYRRIANITVGSAATFRATLIKYQA